MSYLCINLSGSRTVNGTTYYSQTIDREEAERHEAFVKAFLAADEDKRSGDIVEPLIVLSSVESRQVQ